MVLLVVHLSKCKSLAGMIFGWNQLLAKNNRWIQQSTYDTIYHAFSN